MSNNLENLKNVRKQAGLTQKDVEQLLELRPLLIKDFETGRLKLPSDMSLKLAQLYHVSVAELLGADQDHGNNRGLSQLKSLWSPAPEHQMLLDPIISKALEDYHKFVGTKPILHLLLKPLKKIEQNFFIIESIKFINSLIGIDKKIKPQEIALRNHLLEQYFSFSKNKTLNIYLTQAYYPQELEATITNTPLKHFLIWTLFFISSIDKEIDYREREYIEKSAENIQLNKASFELIQSHFRGDHYD